MEIENSDDEEQKEEEGTPSNKSLKTLLKTNLWSEEMEIENSDYEEQEEEEETPSNKSLKILLKTSDSSKAVSGGQARDSHPLSFNLKEGSSK